MAGELMIFARSNDTEVRFISDGVIVTDGYLRDRAFFDSRQQAAAIARACAAILESTHGSAADAEGWHKLPKGSTAATALPNLLAAARNTVWTGLGGYEDAPAPIEDDGISGDAQRPAPEGGAGRQHWSLDRIAWFGFLVGRGLTPKLIARDDIIKTTPNNVYKRASRYGLPLSGGSNTRVSIDLPLATIAAFDRAAALASLPRDAFIKRLLIRAGNDPGRYGLTVVLGPKLT